MIKICLVLEDKVNAIDRNFKISIYEFVAEKLKKLFQDIFEGCKNIVRITLRFIDSIYLSLFSSTKIYVVETEEKLYQK